ncbi:hypothetical protein KPH14_005150 [Odynerus spinipes]|uniref:Aminopeptidase N n=1 Tax=Odynerus spinipes TaxID=1348599 RepID=A0AAD9RKM2_9HYME|nr:hypothetical protein KPH14_005150 [Odynerus spinipes]
MDSHRVLLLILSLAIFLTDTHTENLVSTLQDGTEIQDDSAAKNYRLPTTMHPTAYEITLNLTLSEKFWFLGQATINVIVDTATKSIVLHHGDINILNVSVIVENKEVEIKRKDYDKETEKYSIDLNETLSAGDKILLNFEYEGHLFNNMIGFYKSSYINSDNNIRRLAATQFQTTHARHAFPCFDEPSFKATFTIRLIRTEDYITISNMPLEGSDKISTSPLLYLDTFKKSVPMPTYLVAFAIFDFKSAKKEILRVWARPNAIDQTSYALDVGFKALEQLERLFDQKYELEKLDMVAIPDFSAGAMENWGMITYRESRMLYDERESNVVSQQNVASVILHEITHMWFGNLLTPSWWSYLWLSEGFARYFQYFGTALVEPTWNMEGQFLVEQHQAALAIDAIETSKPMTREVTIPSDIATIGDSITYSKGGSIVRMMSHIIGSDKFHQALRAYIRDSKTSGIVEPKNLWTALQSVNPWKINIAVLMNNWTKQPGFPVLSVKIEKGKATLRQQRFLLRNLKSTPVNVIWHIPITYTTKKNIDFESTVVKQWMTGEQHAFDIDIPDSDWIVFNVQQTGFYRVNYDRDSWYRIINTLNSTNFEKIHVYNRAGIVDDLLNLARAGLLDYKVALNGLQYLQRETNYLPFKAAFRAFDYLTQRFSGDEFNFALYKSYVLSLIENVYQSLGYDDLNSDDRLTVQLRRELNDLACKFGHEECVSTSLKYFRRWKKDAVYRIQPNQRSAAYCMGILHGDFEDWTHLWNHYRTSNVASEQSVVLTALGCSNNTDVLKQYLYYAITSYELNRIRKQDSESVFTSVYSSSLTGANFVLDFVDENHVKMAEYYGGYSAVGSILSGASRYLSTKKLVDKFERLIEKHAEFADIRQSLKNSLEVARYELSWYEEYSNDIVSWIKLNTEFPDGTETTDYRLPGDVVPKKYILSLEPFLEPGNFTFNGYVQIIANVERKTKEIVLHASDIDYHNVEVFVSGTNIDVKLSYKEKYDFLVITLEKMLDVKTEVTIGIRFTGNLNKEMRGFYRSSYINKAGNRIWLAATHLEPVGARKMFPCFDEPAMKAIFAVDVTVPERYHAFSNMKAKEVVHYNETSKNWYRFEDTELMSTYLLALVVSDFEHQKNIVAGRNYSVWARPGTSNETSYSLSLMEPLVDTYEQLLKHEYVLTKLDMVALPDFVSGAMENWGLLTFKESNLLWHPTESNTRSKQSVTNVISHEIAHQWFGDLVSPRWWKYLWLNEGFARYFQYFATSHIKDTWELESQFVVDQLHSAFESDALTSSHPMTHNVYSPEEIRGIFDTISYAKSASVIRMIEKTLGSDVFYAALHQYLEARKFNVASVEDLYTALADQIIDNSLKDRIDKFLDSWTTQAGYPVVNVEILPNTSRVVLSQERFLLRNQKNESIDKIWYIPITWVTDIEPQFNNTKPQFWLTSAQDYVEIDNKEQWIIFNVQQAGYYRVNYDELSWKRIIDTLKSPEFEKIHEVNRAALIDDLMNLARAGYVNYDLLFSATEYLEVEQHYLPWRAFFNGLKYLDRKFEGQDIYKYFKEHVKKIISPLVKKLIHEEEPDHVNSEHTSKLLRMHLLEWSSKYGIGKSIFSPYLTEPDERPALYCELAKGKLVWNILWDIYTKQSTILSEKLITLKALGCSERSEHLNRLLTEAITEDSEIRYQDSVGVFTSVYESSLAGVKFVMEFITLHLQEMYDYYGDYSKIKTIMSGLAKRISTPELYAQYKNVSRGVAIIMPTLSESLKSYDDLILYEHDWFRRNIPAISYWLETRYRLQNSRLPTTLRPVYYSLSISLDNDLQFFNGSVKIDIEVVEPTSQIVLHSHKLRVSSVNVYETSDKFSYKDIKQFEVLGYNEVPESQRLIIYLDTFIDVPKITVEIDYNGEINNRQQGLYRVQYQNRAKNVHYYVATSFHPNYARMAFPCFDEPNFKAKFKINIERPYDYKSLSNTPLEKSVYGITTTLDIYKETPIMSTYLVAFVISQFKPIRNEKEIFNVWGALDSVEKGGLAQYAAFKYYEALQSLITSRKELLKKIDLVGLPTSPVSAMENWGLITFQDSVLFYDEKHAPLSLQHSILTTVARKMAHTYFGNLVTCEWWSHAWINEGLSQYFQWLLFQKGMNQPDISDLFVVNDMHDAMEFDASRFTHPLNISDSTYTDLNKAFDKISYKKAGSLMRMLHRTFGGFNFYIALEDYIDDNQYKTATPNKLWEPLQRMVGENVSVENIMSTWVDKTGYPLLHVVHNKSSGALHLYQTLFMYEDQRDSSFHIPISIATELHPNFEDTSAKFWLTTQQVEIKTNLRDHWFIVNVQQSGYYRVTYDEQSWQKIISLLNSDDYYLIHVINRAQIIDDLFHLARLRKISYDNVFKAALYLRKERDHLPWKAFERGINYIWDDLRLRDHEDRKIIQQYVSYLTNEHVERLGFYDNLDDSNIWPVDVRRNELNREIILLLNCKFGNEECIEKARTLFRRSFFYENLSRNAKPAVLCTGIKYEYSDKWMNLWASYETMTLHSEQVLYLDAFGCTDNKAVLKLYLSYIFDKSQVPKVRREDIPRALASIYKSSTMGWRLCYEYIINKYMNIYDLFQDWDQMAKLFIEIIIRIPDKVTVQEFEFFLKNNENILEPIFLELDNALKIAKYTIKESSYQAEDITYAANKIMVEISKENTNASGIQTSNIFLVMILPMLAFLLIR